jgi:hypothetical protein
LVKELFEFHFSERVLLCFGHKGEGFKRLSKTFYEVSVQEVWACREIRQCVQKPTQQDFVGDCRHINQDSSSSSSTDGIS